MSDLGVDCCKLSSPESEFEFQMSVCCGAVDVCVAVLSTVQRASPNTISLPYDKYTLRAHGIRSATLSLRVSEHQCIAEGAPQDCAGLMPHQDACTPGMCETLRSETCVQDILTHRSPLEPLVTTRRKERMTPLRALPSKERAGSSRPSASSCQ